MANVQIVETSLRDGNQCLWSALGVDTARSLTIAPVMDRVGFKAIDFTTSTHMGVAVRFKKEDPWERIRLMAKAMPKTPLQFLSTGFRFISWETASPEFMALAFKTLIDNGMRRFALADPMNDADSNVACARMIKAAGGGYVIGALVFTLSPIHDDAHYVDRARTLAASPDVDAVYIKDPGGLLTPLRARTLIPAIKAVIGDKPLELHSHCTIGIGELAYMDAPQWGVSAVQCASGAVADGISNPPSERVVSNLRALGHQVDIDDHALAEVGRYFTRLAEAEGLRCQLSPPPIAGRHDRHDAPPPGRNQGLPPGRCRDRGVGPGAPGAWLADCNDSFCADVDYAGGAERHRKATLRHHTRRDHPLRPWKIRPSQYPNRAGRDGSH
jgi:oxaloacetate decarboxylase alpha subunit